MTLVYYLIGVILVAGLLYKFGFLRDNLNQIPEGENVVSPASGKVINVSKITRENASIEIRKGFFGQIETTLPENTEYFMVNIFMNVHNVHFVKTPVAGYLNEVVHRPGKLRAVMSIKNALENEKLEFIISTSYGVIKVIMIAGLVARRCKQIAKEGARLEKGARIGQILLGSQTVLLIPCKNWHPQVEVGDKVSAGESVIFIHKRHHE